MNLFFKIYLQSLRMIRSYRLYSVVNMAGLALSLACVILISKYIWREVSTDRFHKDIDRLYYSTGTGTNDRFEQISLFQDWNNCVDLEVNEQPEIELYTAVIPIPDGEIEADNKKYNARILVADSNFYKIFDFPLEVGNRNTLLRDPRQVIVTRDYAGKIFGPGNPLGKTVSLFGEQLTVAGIAGEIPQNSSISYDIIIPVGAQTDWGRGMDGFFKMYPGADIDALNRRIDIPLSLYPGDKDPTVYRFRPLKGLYLAENISGGDLEQGNPQQLAVFGVIAFVILIIGIFNFVNIYTVILLRRGKELSVKKVFGVSGNIMIGQFVSENAIMVAAATFAGYLLVALFKPSIEKILDIPVVFYAPIDLTLGLAIVVLLPLLTSLYPYLRYKAQTPVRWLSHTGGRRRSGGGRSVFMAAQYVMTIALVIVSLFFVHQLRFMLRADLGYNKDHILKTKFVRRDKWVDPNKNWAAYSKILNEQIRKSDKTVDALNRMPYILRWTTSRTPNVCGMIVSFAPEKYPETTIKCRYDMADKALFEMFGYRMSEGRMFTDSVDVRTANNVIVNETAMKMLGIEKIGDRIRSSESLYFGDPVDNCIYTVIGVIRDFAFDHLSKAVDPLILAHEEAGGFLIEQDVAIQVVPGKEKEVVAFLDSLYREVNGSGEFSYSFVSNEIEAIYREDKRVAGVYSIFTLIAILISSLGLFSLSVYDVQQRYREIAIRKVNGATVPEVMRLLSARYYRILALSFAVAAPLAAYAIHRYIENFAVKAPLSWWIFVTAAFLTAFVSLFTLWWQTWKAATENPAKAVKTE